MYYKTPDVFQSYPVRILATILMILNEDFHGIPHNIKQITVY